MNEPVTICLNTISAATFMKDGARRRLDDLSALESRVRPIIEDVRLRGDDAVQEYTLRFDGADAVPECIEVTDSEIAEACSQADPQVIAALRLAGDKIRDFHERQRQQSWTAVLESGAMMGQLIRPIERVGIYVPGGTAAYPSSVLMACIPARVAGVKVVIACTPPGPGGKANPYVLAAARIAGVNRVFKVGGCQAIAAMAFGTQSVPAVDKIVGPGNAYVTAAKRLVYGYVDIDMLAGPSELAVLADESTNPRFAAADLLSQAEHGPDSQAVLVTTSAAVARRVEAEMRAQVQSLPRREIALRSLNERGLIVIADSLEQAIDAVNFYAPEHLEILVRDPHAALGEILNAGSVLLGPLSPVAATDYAAGPNHVLPTGGTARSWSALSVRDFTRVQNVTSLSRRFLDEILDSAEAIATVEGLDAHAAALRARRAE